MDIRLLLVLTTAMFVARKGVGVLMTLFALHLGAGPFQTGLMFACYGVFPTVFAVPVGRIADRLGNKRLVFVGLGGFTLSVLLPLVAPGLPALFVSASFVGLTSMIFVVATQNLVGLLSTAQTRTRNYSNYSLGESGAAVAGPMLVGYAIDGLGYLAAFAVVAAVTALAFVLFGGRHHDIVDTAPRAAMPYATAASDLLRLPALRNALVANGVVMAGLDLYMLYMPIYGRSIELSAGAIGVMVGVFGAAAFVVRALIPSVTRRWGALAMLAVALAIAATGFVLIPFTRSPWLLAAASFAVGLGIGCGQPLTTILAFNAAPRGRSAEAISMRLVTSYGAHVVIPPVFGALGSALGLSLPFWTCAALLGGGALLACRESRGGGPDTG